MKLQTTSVIAFVIGVASTTGALAFNDTASASLTNVHLTLIDLDPNDGIAPAINFIDNKNYSTSKAGVDGSSVQYQNSTEIIQTAQSTSASAYGFTTSASISGDIFAGNMALKTSSSAPAGGTGYAGGGAQNYSSDGAFELSANTAMYLTATAGISIFNAPLYFGAQGYQSNPTASLDIRYASTWHQAVASYFYDSESYDFSEQRFLSTSLVNSTSSNIFGTMNIGVSASLGNYVAPAIPEPSISFLLMAGLLAMGRIKSLGGRASAFSKRIQLPSGRRSATANGFAVPLRMLATPGR